MASASGPSVDYDSLAERVVNATTSEERVEIYKDLSQSQKKRVRALAREKLDELEKSQKIQEKASVEFEAPDDSEDDLPLTPATTIKTKSVAGTSKPSIAVITDREVSDMWAMLESFDVSQLDSEAIRAFEYEGFNPDLILQALMTQSRANGIKNQEFLRDISILCGLAVVKGTVNDRNYKKMKRTGQETFTNMSKIYGIKMGSAKGQPSDVVTVARIAATFPGLIVSLIHNGKVATRSFPGPMKSSKLPGVMRHQALAACIPRDVPDKLKDFILSSVTAFSVDQSITISQRKVKVETAASDQLNFIRVAHEGRYPSEEVRKTIFNQYQWREYYNEMADCVRELKKIDDVHMVLTKSEYDAEITKYTT